jgi:hypothetical protein
MTSSLSSLAMFGVAFKESGNANCIFIPAKVLPFPILELLLRTDDDIGYVALSGVLAGGSIAGGDFFLTVVFGVASLF